MIDRRLAKKIIIIVCGMLACFMPRIVSADVDYTAHWPVEITLYWNAVYGSVTGEITLEQGDSVGVFDKDGNCYGAGLYDGSHYHLAAFMQETQDPTIVNDFTIPGFKTGDEVFFKLYKVNTQKEYSLKTPSGEPYVYTYKGMYPPLRIDLVYEEGGQGGGDGDGDGDKGDDDGGSPGGGSTDTTGGGSETSSDEASEGAQGNKSMPVIGELKGLVDDDDWKTESDEGSTASTGTGERQEGSGIQVFPEEGVSEIPYEWGKEEYASAGYNRTVSPLLQEEKARQGSFDRRLYSAEEPRLAKYKKAADAKKEPVIEEGPKTPVKDRSSLFVTIALIYIIPLILVGVIIRKTLL